MRNSTTKTTTTKNQTHFISRSGSPHDGVLARRMGTGLPAPLPVRGRALWAVSYTHLTLPTS